MSINRQFLRGRHSFSQLKSLISNMKVKSGTPIPKGDLSKFGNSETFKYATTRSDLGHDSLKIWDRLKERDLDLRRMAAKRYNGFDEMIRLTEDGRLWQYPIDNEAALDEQKQVPFEEHVFLDKHLEDFPKSESIRAFMELVLMGLSNNPYITVERKIETIKWYKGYFESKRDAYSQAGFDIDK